MSATDRRREYQRAYYRELATLKGVRAPVPTEAVANHIEQLLDVGMPLLAIHRASGVAYSTLDVIRQRRFPTVRAGTADKVLAVRLAMTPIGVTRRVRALNVMGWSCADIADVAGVHKQVVESYRAGGIHYPRVAAHVCAAYEALAMKAPVRATRYDRSRATLAANAARRNGWAPPLAWDDDTIDDPTATPDLGAHESGTDLDEFMFLVRGGEEPARAARRLSVTESAIERAAYRHERADVLQALRAVAA